VIFAESLHASARRKGDAMVSVKVASVAGAVALFATVANAADMPGLPPIYPPPVEEFSVSGWYLRGDIGMTNQQFKKLHQRLYDAPTTLSVTAVGMGWDSSTFFGLGAGYKFNDWFRADVTGEYRGKANFHGSDIYQTVGGPGVDNYSGSKSEWVFMANAYVDLGTWWCLTPYVGLGICTANAVDEHRPGLPLHRSRQRNDRHRPVLRRHQPKRWTVHVQSHHVARLQARRPLDA
jgi:opacity protein-like surface antigen